jgi:uroporphyrinogen-III synthase
MTRMIDLKAKRILVTRPKEQAKNLCCLINFFGGYSIEYPTIDIVLSNELTDKQLRNHLHEANYVIFISRNAVKFSNDLIKNLCDVVQGKTIFATGPGTAKALMKTGINFVEYPSTNYSSEGLLELKGLSSSCVNNINILIVRGDEGREFLKESLQIRGANVKYANIYRRKIPDLLPDFTDSIWKHSIPDIIVITSNQGLKNLIEMIGIKYTRLLFNCRLVVMSSRISETATKLGFARIPIVAGDQTDEGLILAIAESVEL